MKSLSRQEYIATAIAVIVAGAFFSVVYASFDVTNAQQTLQKAVTGTAQINRQLARNGANVQVTNKPLVAEQPTVSVQDFSTGKGASAEYGDTIYIQYVAKLDNGKEFANSTTNPEPIKVILKKGKLLAGLEAGILNMKESGVREIVIPPELAYGSSPIADAKGKIIVPAYSTVVYDVVLLKVVKPGSSS